MTALNQKMLLLYVLIYVLQGGYGFSIMKREASTETPATEWSGETVELLPMTLEASCELECPDTDTDALDDCTYQCSLLPLFAGETNPPKPLTTPTAGSTTEVPSGIPTDISTTAPAETPTGIPTTAPAETPTGIPTTTSTEIPSGTPTTTAIADSTKAPTTTTPTAKEGGSQSPKTTSSGGKTDTVETTSPTKPPTTTLPLEMYTPPVEDE